MRARRIASLGGPALALALVLAGCGGGGPSTTPTAPTTTAPANRTLEAYFFRDAALTPVRIGVPASQAVATEALGALLAGPPSGYDTALPEGVRLLELKIASGIAVARFSSRLGRPTRSAQAQIVATLTQFPTVHGVQLQEEGTSGALRLEDGAGRAIPRPATAADYADLTARAAIFVRKPPRDSSVSSPVHASGTADVFEGAFEVDVWSGGRRLRAQPIQATSGTGTRGTWSATVALPPGPAKLVFYEPSAANGEPLHTTTVFLNVR